MLNIANKLQSNVVYVYINQNLSNFASNNLLISSQVDISPIKKCVLTRPNSAKNILSSTALRFLSAVLGLKIS